MVCGRAGRTPSGLLAVIEAVWARVLAAVAVSSLLVGVCLSAVPRADSGNLLVWPGSHFALHRWACHPTLTYPILSCLPSILNLPYPTLPYPTLSCLLIPSVGSSAARRDSTAPWTWIASDSTSTSINLDRSAKGPRPRTGGQGTEGQGPGAQGTEGQGLWTPVTRPRPRRQAETTTTTNLPIYRTSEGRSNSSPLLG